MSIVPGDKCKSFGILAFSVTFKHKVRDAELLAGSLVNLPLRNDKITFVNRINTVIDKVLSSKNKVYFNILDMAETKEMITILSVAMYSSLTTVLQI